MNVGVFRLRRKAREFAHLASKWKFLLEQFSIALLIYDLKRRSKTVSLLSDGRMRPADARDGRGLRVRGGAMALPDIGVDDRIHSACANPALWSPSNFNVSLVYAATTPSKGLLACGYTPASFHVRFSGDTFSCIRLRSSTFYLRFRNL